MTPLRAEARRMAEESQRKLISNCDLDIVEQIESALLAFAKLVLEREPSDAMLRAMWSLRAANTVETIHSTYRAMTAELLKELAP